MSAPNHSKNRYTQGKGHNKVVPTDISDLEARDSNEGEIQKPKAQSCSAVASMSTAMSTAVMKEVNVVTSRPWMHAHPCAIWCCFLVDVISALNILCEMAMVCTPFWVLAYHYEVTLAVSNVL